MRDVKILAAKFAQVASNAAIGVDAYRLNTTAPSTRPWPTAPSGPTLLASTAKEKRICYLASMAVRSCRVTIQDLEGVAHTVEVTAESLYEAVAQALAALRRSDWVAGFQQDIVKVSVGEVRVEHQVRFKDFTEWLNRPGRSPRDIVQRQRIRSILGMAATS